jgi:hypothetical protein
MGQRASLPPLPMMDALQLPHQKVEGSNARTVTIRCTQRENNWLQSAEGDLDTSHFSFLHLGKVKPEDLPADSIHRWVVAARAPQFQARATDWGTSYGAYRPADPGHYYYRVAHFLLPFWTMFPDSGFDQNMQLAAWVPMDDTHVMQFSIFTTDRATAFSTTRDGGPIPGITDGSSFTEAFSSDFLPNTSDWFGRWRASRNRGNDYGLDRTLQRNVTYSGINGIPVQDAAVTEGMGDIQDRTLETLAPSDIMVVRTRRRLLDAVRGVAAGAPPPLLDNPTAARHVRSGSFLAPSDLPWFDAYAQALGAALAKETE